MFCGSLNYWLYRHSMQSTVYVMVGCLSICLSHRLTAATAAGGFAAEHPAGRRYRWIDVLQMSFCRRQRWAANAGSVMLRTDNQGSIRTCVNMQLEGSRVCRAGGDYDWLAYKFTETMLVFYGRSRIVIDKQLQFGLTALICRARHGLFVKHAFIHLTLTPN